MSLQVEKLEHNMAKLTIEVSGRGCGEGTSGSISERARKDQSFRDSVKEKRRASLSRRCTDRKCSMMRQPII